MAYYLCRPNEETFRCGLTEWPAVVSLAKAYNWKAQGTTLKQDAISPVAKTRGGRYETMDGAGVTAADANDMADALERALVHWPREDISKTTQLALRTNVWSPPNLHQQRAMSHFLERSDESRLIEIIAFLRQGAFELH